jgi:carboxyl-terminal processing protease
MCTRRFRITLAAPLLALLATTAIARPASAGLNCGDIQDLITIYFQKHIRFHQMTEDLRRRTIENYLRQLDPQAALFLEAEVQELFASLDSVFRETEKGDCTRLLALQQEIVARHREMEGFVRGFVGSDEYRMDPTAELLLDPEERGHPKTKEERDALLRILSHFGISNYLETGTDLAEAKSRLIHRNELQTRRSAEKRREDVYAEFLDAFATALDPHSGYLSADDVEDFQIQMQLSLEGIGVALTERDGYAVVEQIIPGGAADRLEALQPMDRIIAVAEEGEPPVDVIDMALRDVVRLIRGKKGTRVELTVLRQGERTERFQVAIERDTVDLKEQAAKLSFETVVADDRKLKLAVLDLPSFYGDQDPTKRKGSRDVARLLQQARDAKADGLILDLSLNGGGLLEDAVAISGFFINQGGIVAVQESGEKQGRVMGDPDRGILFTGPMVILVSRWSASASEILAGALKDYGRALIVGDDHTFGKGTVQSVFPLQPGLGALKITTALFFRPGGTSTQITGVTADVVLPSLNMDALGERDRRNSLSAQPIPPFRAGEANGGDEKTRFEPITPQTVAVAAGRSKRRVLEDEYFQEVEKELADRERDEGVVRLSELIRRREEANGGEGSSKHGVNPTGETGSADADTAGVAVARDPEEEADPSPQMREAIQILADMITESP